MNVLFSFDNNAGAKETDADYDVSDYCQKSAVSSDDFVEVFGGAHDVGQIQGDH